MEKNQKKIGKMKTWWNLMKFDEMLFSSNFIKFHQVFIFPIFLIFSIFFSMKKIQVPMTKLQSLWVPPKFVQTCHKKISKEMVDAVQRVFQNHFSNISLGSSSYNLLPRFNFNLLSRYFQTVQLLQLCISSFCSKSGLVKRLLGLSPCQKGFAMAPKIKIKVKKGLLKKTLSKGTNAAASSSKKPLSKGTNKKALIYESFLFWFMYWLACWSLYAICSTWGSAKNGQTWWPPCLPGLWHCQSPDWFLASLHHVFWWKRPSNCEGHRQAGYGFWAGPACLQGMQHTNSPEQPQGQHGDRSQKTSPRLS